MQNNLPIIKFSLFFLLLCVLNSCTSLSKETPKESVHGLTADSGMVVSAHPQGSEIGVDILKKGGNAIDAAVATGFALAVCYPEAGNLGGGGFMLIRTREGICEVIDFREKAPSRSSRAMFLDKNCLVSEGLSTETHLASGVPGSVDGLLIAHQKYGRLPLNDVIQPAIDLAANGFTIARGQGSSLNSNREQFIKSNPRGTAFVKDSLWKDGDILVQPDLAETLKRIRDNGREGFYSGKTAGLIIDEMNKGNGIITLKDLQDYKSISRAPLTSDYKGFKIITVPPPSGGGIILIQLLKMIEPFSIRDLGFHSPEAIHLIAEAEKRAFADRSEYSGDPDFVKIPIDTLLNSKYLLKRMSDFNKDHATPAKRVLPGQIGNESMETTHYSIVDNEGNAVSVTTTLNGTFGNSIVVEGAGFLLNNEMDDFSIKPGYPNMYGLIGGEANSISPGKRMLSSMTPVIVEKEGKLILVAGSPGGSTIPTSVFQVVTNIIDFNMGIQEAVDAGRFHHQWLPDKISYEKNAFDSVTVLNLSKLGHELRSVPSLGRVNAILIRTNGTKEGGADPRGFNSSCGY